VVTLIYKKDGRRKLLSEENGINEIYKSKEPTKMAKPEDSGSQPVCREFFPCTPRDFE
jgi:hypothetical protein